MPLLKSKKKCFPSKVYLCASGRINEAARHHILEEVRDPRITFLDADELIPLIDEHFPEYWFEIDADILPYYRAIKELVEGKPARDTGEQAFKSDVLIGAATDQSYISLTLYKTTVKKKKISGRFVELPDFEEIPVTSVIHRRKHKTLILGEAGSGKSTALLRIAYEAARKGIESDMDYMIPILLRAVEICRAKPETLVEYCDYAAKHLADSRNPCFGVSDLQEGRVIVLVDALDEIAEQGPREEIVELINQFSRDYPRVRLVITSRPYAFVRDMKALSSFEVFNISPINWKQASKIVKKLQEGKKVAPQNSKELLRRIEQVHGIELNPLLVTVFAATTEYSRQDVPANITELFKKFTELMLGRWDESKGLSQQYQAPLKDFLLTKVAFKMHQQEKIRITIAEFEEIVVEQLHKRGHRAQIDQILDETLYRSGLFRIVGHNIEFRHHLLQEFFAGRGIPSEDFVKQVVTNEWWKRAIVFYFGERPSEIGILQEVMKTTSEKVGGCLVEAATTIGLALQACYLSEVEKKLEVWKSVATALSIARDMVVENIDKEHRYPVTSFVHYYLYGRDAVALSNIKDNLEELEHWVADSTLGNMEEQEAKLFWFISALIEIGELGLARKLIEQYKPEELRYLLAIHLGCYLTKELRQIEQDGKEDAEEICKRLEKKVEPLRVQLMKEFGSQLLEIRSGQVTALDPEEKSADECV